jgi:hypothetical protein
MRAELDGFWKGMSLASAATMLNDVLPGLIDEYGAAAATLAADWYNELRAQREVKRRFEAVPADIANTGVGALVGWAADTATDDAAFTALILGGAQRRVSNFSRLTVTTSSVADPGARGWRRVGDGSSCDFCSMLLGRGAVYTEATADFASHDHCHCQAEPEFA